MASFLKSESEKNVFKTISFIFLVHAGSFGGAPSVMSLPLRGGSAATILPKGFNTFFSSPDFRKIYRSARLTV